MISMCRICVELPCLPYFHTTSATIGAEAHQPMNPPRRYPHVPWTIVQTVFVPERAISVQGDESGIALFQPRYAAPEPAFLVLVWTCQVVASEPPPPITSSLNHWTCRCGLTYANSSENCRKCGQLRGEL